MFARGSVKGVETQRMGWREIEKKKERTKWVRDGCEDRQKTANPFTKDG